MIFREIVLSSDDLRARSRYHEQRQVRKGDGARQRYLINHNVANICRTEKQNSKHHEKYNKKNLYLSSRNPWVVCWNYQTLLICYLLIFILQAVLEYLKFDIEAWEFEVLQQIIRTGVLNQVKQMAFELHMTKFHEVGGSGLYITTYEALLELERQGFRKFFTHQNPNSVFVNPRTGRESKGCCFEIYYINLRFLAHRISTNESLKRA